MLEKLRSIYLQILSAGIIIFLILIPLMPKIPFLGVSETYVSIRLEDFIIGLFAFLLLPIIWKERKILLRDNLILAILGFWIIGFFSVFGAIFITHSVVPHLAILHYLRRIEYMVPFLIIYTTRPELPKIKNYFKILILTSITVFIYGIGQMYLNFPVFSTTNKEFSKGIMLSLGSGARVNSTFAGHYDLAAYLALILVVLISFLFVASSGIRGKILKLFLLVLIISDFWLLLQTASRISFSAYLAGAAVVLLLLKKRAFLVILLFISLVSLLSSDEIRLRFFNTFKYGIKTVSGQVVLKKAFALIPTQSTSSATQDAILDETNKPYKDIVPGEPEDPTQVGVYRSSRVRFDFEWPAAIRGFLRNPIMGSGYSSLGIATDNDYLRSLGEVGLAGTVAFALIFIEIGKRIKSFLKKPRMLNFEKITVIGLTGVIFAFLVNATFIDVFEASKIAILFWMLIGFLVVTIKKVDETQIN